jgi:hypothetical protein
MSPSIVWVVLSWVAGQCPEAEGVFAAEEQAWLYVDAETRLQPERFFRVQLCELTRPVHAA